MKIILLVKELSSHYTRYNIDFMKLYKLLVLYIITVSFQVYYSRYIITFEWYYSSNNWYCNNIKFYFIIELLKMNYEFIITILQELNGI